MDGDTLVMHEVEEDHPPLVEYNWKVGTPLFIMHLHLDCDSILGWSPEKIPSHKTPCKLSGRTFGDCFFFFGGETIPNKRIPSLVDGKNLSLAHSNLTLPVNVTADCGFALFASLSHLLRDFSVETIGPST